MPKQATDTARSAAALSPLMLSVPIPREALTLVAAPPDTLTQRNVLAATGIPPRTFLELLREDGAPAAVHVGKLRLVDRVAFVAWLRLRARAAKEKAPAPSLDAADAFAAGLGFGRVTGDRR